MTEENKDTPGGLISKDEAIKIAEEQGGSRDEIEPEKGSIPEPEPATAETPEPKKAVNEIKVMIYMKDDSFLLGVQSPDCDPVFKSLDGTMTFALKQVPGLIKEAKAKWADAPLNPKAVLPEPPPPPPRPAMVRTVSRTPTSPPGPQMSLL